MSLQLRKMCQPILDNAGLSNYHVRINDHHYTLSITEECGKSLFDINGIQFTRKAPTKTEMEYGAELLNAFLIKHAIKINEYNKIKSTMPVNPEKGHAWASAWDVSEDNKKFTIYRLNDLDFELNYLDGIMLCTITTKDKKVLIRTRDNKFYSIKEIHAYKVNTDLEKEYRKVLKQYALFNKANKKLKVLTQSFETCEI